jgi:alpha-tubulin suppressor-like RCC1 family protein
VVFPADAAPIRAISAGDGFSCSIMTDGRAYCWGRNDRGQLGDGSTTDRDAPVLVGGGTTFDPAKSVATGSAHACATRADGAVFCWGANDRGQLGDGTTVDRTAPVQVNAAAAFVTLAAGGAHSCGLTSSGAAYCWGANDAGQLGTGTFGGSHLMPERVSLSAPLLKISTGRDHTCALAVSGDAGVGAPYCWGLNTDGQLGDGTTTNRNVPTPVADFHP